MYDICCVGHLTLDKVVTTKAVMHMAGGTSLYFSNGMRNMGVKYLLVTSLAEKEMDYVRELRDKNIEVKVFRGTHTVYFENIYSENMDHRTQKVSQTADPFTIQQLSTVQASLFHLGPLLANDIPLALIQDLAKRGKVSLDVQGYLRTVRNQDVFAIDWNDKMEGLRYLHTLKANESEMEVLTGLKNVHDGARLLNEWGVKEVVITLGSMGSVIYADDIFHTIPAYVPREIVDTTGCGDTYMAGYLYKRIKGDPPQEAGEFAAAMASSKIEASGPFTGNEKDVLSFLAQNKNIVTW